MRKPKGCETIKDKAGEIQEPGVGLLSPLSLVRVDSVTLVWLVECDQLCVNKELLLHPKPEALCILLEDTTCKYSHHTDF